MIDLSELVAARLDRLLDRLGELVEQAPERELAPALGDVHGPIGRPADSPPLAWPEGLPWPLTARQALDAVQASRTLLADEMTAEIGAAVAVLVAQEARETVLADPELVAAWRPPVASVLVEGGEAWYGDKSYAARVALWRLLASWAQELEPADLGRWPDPQLSHSDVARWAREALNRLYPAKPAVYQSGLGLDPQAFAAEFPGKLAAGDALVAEVESWGEIRHTRWIPSQDRLRVELHRSGLAAVCLAVRRLPCNLAAAAWEAVQTWASDAPGDVHNAAARQALEQAQGPAEAVAMLARELWAMCPSLVAKVARPPALDPQEVPERDGMLTLDADVVDWLTGLRKEVADEVQKAARERLTDYHQGKPARHLFNRWLDGTALRLVARILWDVRVLERWERQQSQHPAATSGVLSLLLSASDKPQLDLPLAGVAPANLKDKRGRILADFSAAGLDADTLTQMFRGRSLLATVAGTRLVRWELVTAHKQWLEMSGTGGDFRRTVVEGAWSGLAHLIGEHSKATVEQIRDMVKAQAHGVFNLPGGRRGNLLGYDEPTRPAPGKTSTLTLYWQDPLLPGYVHSLPPGKEGESHRRNRVLVPVLDSLPDLGGSGYYAGSIALLHWLVMLDIAQGAPELKQYGGVCLNWSKLWADAGLPEEQGRKLLDRWTTDGDNAPAFLRDIGGGRYALGDAHAKAEAFILARNNLAAAKATKAAKNATRKRS